MKVKSVSTSRRVPKEFINAVITGNMDQLSGLISSTVGLKYLDHFDKGGNTILHYATSVASTDVINYLFEYAEKNQVSHYSLCRFVNVQNDEGFTAVNFLFKRLLEKWNSSQFCFNNQSKLYDTLNLLSGYGVDFTISGPLEVTPLYFAAQVPYLEERVFSLLMTQTEETVLHTRVGRDYVSPMCHIYRCGNTNALKAILEKRNTLKEEDKSIDTTSLSLNKV